MNMRPDARLEDREAIRDIITVYAHAIDRRRWDIMPGLFHDDAEFGFGVVAGGWRDFVEQARGVIDPCLATQHQLGQILFGFEGDDVCHTETYMTAMHTIPPGHPMPEIFPPKDEIYSAVIAGRYVDIFEKRDGAWKIAKRTGIYDWREFRVVEGIDMSELGPDGQGKHDDTDPSTAAAAKWRG
ncbi:MAG: nuclear transport factor 2 family protein [Marinomonas sp.]